MKYAFSPAGLLLLEKLSAEPALLAFDFDGTLAPLVRHVSSARIPAPTAVLLEKLADRGAALAAVSGRSMSSLRPLVPKTFLALAGDHGAEIQPARFGLPGESRTAALTVKSWIRQLTPRLVDLPGVWIETKKLSLCVHFRESRKREVARRKILEAVAHLEPGPRALPGICVVNLLNPRLPHKGDAVLTLMRKMNLRSALYVGDDSNDEDVFALSNPRILSLRVGRKRESRAALFLHDRSEMNRLLRFLLSLYKPSR